MAEETVTSTDDQADTTAVVGAADDTDLQARGGDPKAGDSPDDGAADDEDDDADDDQDAISLIGQKEFDAVKNDPKKLAKALNRAFTQNSQKNAEALRFVEALNTNPVDVITELAKRANLKVGPGGTDASHRDETMESLIEIFGPEVAATMGPLIEKITDAVVEKKLGPIRTAQDISLAETARTQSEAVLSSFQAKHPDWKKHEKAMLEASKRISMGKGVTELQYMEDLYHLATRDIDEADRVKGVVDRMGKSVRATDPGAVPAGRVSPAPTKAPTFSEAYAAAKRGVRFED